MSRELTMDALSRAYGACNAIRGSHGDLKSALDDLYGRADAAEATLARVRNALAALDGHTCHEGHTDADHLSMYRAVVAEVRAALEGAA